MCDVLPDSERYKSLSQMANITDTNPYAPPACLLNAPKQLIPSHGWLGAFAILQFVFIVPFIAANLYNIFSVYVTGPIFSLAGLCVTLIAYLRRDIVGVIYGSSAVIFTCFVWFLIDYIPWTPTQARLPVAFLSLGYATLAALPLFIRMKKRKAEEL